MSRSSHSLNTRFGPRFAGIVVLSIALVAVAAWMAQLGWHGLLVRGIVQSEQNSLGALWKTGLLFQTERMRRWFTSFSRDPALATAIVEGNVNLIASSIEPTYNRLTTLGVMSAVTLVNSDSVSVYAAPDQKHPILPVRSVTEALKERRVVMGIDTGVDGTPIVVAVSPLYAGRGILAGAVVLTQDMDAVLQILARSSTDLLMVLDHSGRLHAASDPNLAGKFLESIKPKELSHDRGLIALDGRDWRWVAYPVDTRESQARFHVVSISDETETVRASYFAFLVLLGGTLFVITMVMAWIYRYIVRQGELLRLDQEQRIAELDAANKAAAQANDQLKQIHLELSKLFVEKEQTHAQESELRHRLEETQGQLLQVEKMASIGQLAAGVAHEINNPIGYISSNVMTLDGYIRDLIALFDAYADAEQQPLDSEAWRSIATLKSKLDLAYLREDIGKLLEESKDGLKQVKRIVQDLKDFSHVDGGEWSLVDLHRGIDSTINVVWNELKYKAEVVREYGALPHVN